MDKSCVLSVGAQDCVSLQLHVIGTVHAFVTRSMQSNTKQRWSFFSLLIEREGKGNQSNDGDHISKVDNCVGLEACVTQLKF